MALETKQPVRSHGANSSLGSDPLTKVPIHNHNKASDSLEMQGRVARILLQQGLSPIGLLLQGLGQRVVANARSEVWPDASKVPAAPRLQVSQGFHSQPIQRPGFHVVLQLLIPVRRIKTFEPGAEPGKPCGIKLLDGSLGLQGHPSWTRRRQTRNYSKGGMVAITKLFLSNRSQAVRIPAPAVRNASSPLWAAAGTASSSTGRL
jgi:hypothetical protein